MNKVTNFNKNISHMLALRFSFCFLLASLVLACSPAAPNFTRIQLGQWTVNDAAFSLSGTLAVSVSQDIGIYTSQGSLEYLFQLPPPEGLWQIAWQDQTSLWVYDRYHFYYMNLSNISEAQHKMSVAHGIRFVTASSHGLLLVTENNQVHWHAFTDQGTVKAAVTLFDYLPHVTSIGTTSGDRLYVATQQGDVWLWDKSDYKTVKHYKLDQPVHSLVNIDQTLYALTSESLSPLAHQSTLQLWPLTPTHALQPQLIENSLGITSTFALDNRLIIGGSQNSWLSYNTETLQVQASYRQKRKPQHSSRIVAIDAQGSVILMLNSQGTLQIWPKTRIFEYPQH